MTKPTRGASPESSATLSGYDLWSQSYDSFANPMIAMAEWALDHAPLDIEDKRVLEIGCGTGRNVHRLLREGARTYLGIDGSSGMLAQARARYESFPQVAWKEADIRKELPAPSAAFDLVIITLVLEHIPHLGPLFKEIARVLNDHGRVRIIEIHADMIKRGTQAHFWHDGKEHKLESFPHLDEDYQAAFASAGLAPHAITDWFPPSKLIQKLPKLAKHMGHPMIIDLTAGK